MWGLRSSRSVAIGLALLAFALMCALPVVYMVESALPDAGRVISGVLFDARQRGLLSTTVIVGVGSALLATLVGAPLGFVLARAGLPMNSLLRIGLAAPALLPPYVVALAWTRLPSVLFLVDSSAPLPWTYTTAGVVIVMAAVLYPLPMLVGEIALRRVDGHLEDAAMLVASPARVLSRITLPLVAPAILSTSLIVMVLAISEFAVPGLLRVRVFTTEVFTAFAALYDSGRATALALPLLIVGMIGAVVAVRLLAASPIVGSRAMSRRSALTFERWSIPAALAVASVFAATVIAPVLVLVVDTSQSTSLADVLRGSGVAALNTLVFAAAGASAVTLLASVLGYARSGIGSTAGAAVDALWIALFCVPSTIIGIGLIGVWNRPSVPPVYGTAIMIVLGYVARLLPVAALVLGAVVRGVPRSHEEAAAVAGATWGGMVWSVLLPETKSALTATWVLVFVLAAGEVGTTILVAPPGESTLPIRAYTLVANAPPGRLAGLALVQAAIVLLPLILLAAVAARRRESWPRPS